MAREKRDATKVSYMIDNELLKQLEDFCERTGRTKTKVIEMAISLYLEEHKKGANFSISPMVMNIPKITFSAPVSDSVP